MRALAHRLLEPGVTPAVPPPAADELEDLILRLRGHLSLLAPEVEELALALSVDSVLRYCALACVGEARGKLRAAPLPGPNGAAAYARRLARQHGRLSAHDRFVAGRADLRAAQLFVVLAQGVEGQEPLPGCAAVRSAGGREPRQTGPPNALRERGHSCPTRHPTQPHRPAARLRTTACWEPPGTGSSTSGRRRPQRGLAPPNS
ncbi:DUF6415 family natural product biosynthesis protein [Streptomyces justiciae]|uniref:DUF6415 family natural product biosynthesis protein n=1 Tax=Streptomyces justiciae TaxID=2780140 RepID=UPI0036F1A8F6